MFLRLLATFGCLLWAIDAFPKLTLSDIPVYKFPCAGNITSPRLQARCKSHLSHYGFGRYGLGFNDEEWYNNVYCKVYRICLNFSYGNLYLSSYAFWRSKGYFPERDYRVHSSAAGSVGEGSDIVPPSTDAIRNAIADFRSKTVGLPRPRPLQETFEAVSRK